MQVTTQVHYVLKSYYKLLMKNISEIPDIKKLDINAYNYASDVYIR